ncbi:Hypothetical protein A7982_05907 [Minicystis rosea]|nr:Hypothetical protein A7982_05907 [Minicystis rosea]
MIRLQLTGDDAMRIASIVARLESGIDRAKAQASDGAQRFAEAATTKTLSQAAHGHTDYRGRAMSRDDLLAIVESPASTAEARAAAAHALGHAVDAVEQERLRVAAGLCAEPAARAVLLRVATTVDDDGAIAAEDEAAEDATHTGRRRGSR